MLHFHRHGGIMEAAHIGMVIVILATIAVCVAYALGKKQSQLAGDPRELDMFSRPPSFDFFAIEGDQSAHIEGLFAAAGYSALSRSNSHDTLFNLVAECEELGDQGDRGLEFKSYFTTSTHTFVTN